MIFSSCSKYLDNFYPEIGYENIYTRKKYVSDPQVSWLKNELYEWTLDRISSKFLKKSNLYNQVSMAYLDVWRVAPFANDLDLNISLLFYP